MYVVTGDAVHSRAGVVEHFVAGGAECFVAGAVACFGGAFFVALCILPSQSSLYSYSFLQMRQCSPHEQPLAVCLGLTIT